MVHAARRFFRRTRTRGYRDLQDLDERGYLTEGPRPMMLGWLTFFSIVTIGLAMFLAGRQESNGTLLLLLSIAAFGVAVAVSIALATAHYWAARQLDEAQAELLTVHGELEVERTGRRSLIHDASAVVGAMGAALHALERSGEQPRIFSAMASQVDHLRTLLATPSMTLRPTPLSSFKEPLLSFAGLHDMSLSVDLPAQVHVLAEPASVSTILQNLVDNARKYALGSPVRVVWEPAGQYVRLCVEDRGPGLGDHPDELFERGVRGGDNAEGFGLGLATSRRLAEQNQGALWFERPSGPGSRFVLKLTRVGEVDHGAHL